MKRCPTCNRTFTDDTQRFCLDDGATLIEETASTFDPQATLAMPAATPTSPPSNPYGSGAGMGSSGSGAGQASPGSGSNPGSFGSASGQSQQAGSWSPPRQHFTPVSTSAKKRSVLPWVLGGIAVVALGVVGIVIVIAIAMSGSSSKKSSAPLSNVIRSTDGKIQVSAPTTWKSTTELNDKADLQVSDTANQVYLIVLSDTKADYDDMDLAKHSTGTLEALTNSMTSSTKVGPSNLTIGGNRALQYEVRGEIKNLKVVYLHTTIETPTNYQQIVAWTLQSRYDERQELLKKVVTSFQEN